MARSQFWSSLRQGIDGFRSAFTGQRPDSRIEATRKTTPLQQAYGVGAVTTYPISNKWEELGHDTSWNYVGIHTLAKQWGQASWVVEMENDQIVRKSFAADESPHEKTVLHRHPQLALLENPNPMMGRVEFLYITCTHLRLTGEFCYWEVPGQDGNPAHYWPIPRSWMTWLPGTIENPLGIWQVRNYRASQGYLANNPLAGGFLIDARHMIIGKWPHPVYPAEGLSPMTACSRVIDIMEQTDDAVWNTMVQAYHNGMILLLDKSAEAMTEEQIEQMVRRFQEKKGGTGNAGRVSALQAVNRIERPSITLSEMQSVEVRKQNQEFALGVQGVPSIATGIQSGEGTYAGTAATVMAFAEMGVKPDLDLFSSVLTRRAKLCGYWQDRGPWKLVGHAKRIDDPTIDLQRQDKYLAGYDKGIFTLNEVRAVFKEKPVTDGTGDERKEQQVPGSPITQNFHNGQPQADDLSLPGDESGADDLDLDMDLPDEESTGMRVPQLQRAGGRAFSTNGRH